MIRLDESYKDHIYVLAYDAGQSCGDWRRHVDIWCEEDPESGGLTPPGELFEPMWGFGKLWREKLGGPDAEIGWALAPEQGYVGNTQIFKHGRMLWNSLDGAVYVLWEDYTWTAYPALR